MPTITPSLNQDLLEKVPASLAARWRAMPLGREADGTVIVAAIETDDAQMIENLQVLLGAPVSAIPFSEPDLKKAIEERYGLGAAAVEDMATGGDAMIPFVNGLIRQAIAMRATDIHIEPFDNELLVRFRIDGLLHEIPVPPTLTRYEPLLASRIKIMGDMNIAEKRLPQDGRIRFTSDGEDLDIRVSTIPTLQGESIDMRLLPRSRLALGLEELGMSADHRDAMAALIRKPNGIVLVTGPTGHGKTTTLYACLSRINTPDKKIITIEDPVEYRMRGVNQIQTHSKIGLTFANGLRAVLRQDPDVIMVGEVRDLDTAEIAIRASLTGHLVFSTLHTNDAIGAITRLIDMGIEPYLVASSIHAIVAQRLIRLSCPPCAECRQTGFRGRTGIFELLLINDEIRQLIITRAPQAEIRKKARALGMHTMFEDGRDKAGAGLTHLSEVLRVTEEMA